MVEDFLFNDKPYNALKTLRRNHMDDICATEISTKIDTTYAHTIKIVSELADADLVRRTKKGRRKNIKLTEDGERVADLLLELEEVLQ